MLHNANATFCTQIGHHNAEYCGIKKQWTPRLSTVACTACVALPATFAFIWTIVGIPIIWRNYKKLNLFEKEKKKGMDPDGTYTRYKWLPVNYRLTALKFSVYYAPIIPLLWDTIDVVLDGLYFYNLEQGDMISVNITRSVYVNNTLMTFGAIGALKTPLLVLIIGQFWDILFTPQGSEFTFKMVALSPSAIGNLYISIIIYLSEDCIELFLEYFWIEKYIADHPSSIVVSRNIISALVSIIPLIGQLVKLKDRWFIAEQIDSVKQRIQKNNLRKGTGKDAELGKDEAPMYTDVDAPAIKLESEKAKRQKVYIIWLALSVITLMSGIGSFLRAMGALHQVVFHKIPQSCLKVSEKGLLMQDPLDDNCLRFIDYCILFFNFLPLVTYVLCWFISTLFSLVCSFYSKISPQKTLNVNKPRSDIKIDMNDNKVKYSILISFNEHDEPNVIIAKSQ